ncbi:hypothetical protein ABZW47_03990 [Streptomyces sp. NPDC004549]|uniref:hypothetical protein n=1 Tax=Streptomyces sp. NPDC004549 TaxID=3154283 RepID=UPI0033B89EDD
MSATAPGGTSSHFNYGGVATFVMDELGERPARRAVPTPDDQPIHPTNLYADHPLYHHAEYREHVTEPQVERVRARGIRC